MSGKKLLLLSVLAVALGAAFGYRDGAAYCNLYYNNTGDWYSCRTFGEGACGSGTKCREDLCDNYCGGGIAVFCISTSFECFEAFKGCGDWPCI